MPAYTNADVQAAMDAIDNATLADGLGVFETGTVDKVARTFLDAVAPAIAARALREAARELSRRIDAERISRADLFTAISVLADEIARTT